MVFLLRGSTRLGCFLPHLLDLRHTSPRTLQPLGTTRHQSNTLQLRHSRKLSDDHGTAEKAWKGFEAIKNDYERIRALGPCGVHGLLQNIRHTPDAAVKIQRYRSIINIFRYARRPLTNHPYNDYLIALGSTMTYENVLKILDEMKSVALKPSAYTFNTMLRNFYLRKDYTSFDNLLLEMDKVGIRRYSYIHTQILRRTIATEGVETAEELLKALMERGEDVDYLCWGVVIVEYRRMRNYEKVHELCKNFKATGKSLDAGMYLALI